MAKYQIKPGETMIGIAKANGTTADYLASLNGIKNAGNIRAGATIDIPDNLAAAKAAMVAAPAAPNTVSTLNTAAQTPSYGAQPAYQQSQALVDATKRLTEYESSQPGEYQSEYGDQIQGLLDQILNRKDFSYNFNADPMYQQYKDRYAQQGKMAMMDTMGNAAALSGGYGNSYAQTAGQQTYQGYLQGVNDVIPELQQAALSAYQNKGNDMNNKLGLVQGMEENDYGRYQDSVAAFNNERGYLYGKVSDMSDDELARYSQDLAKWQSDRDYSFNQSQADQSQNNWQTQWDYQLAQDAEAAAAKGSGGSGGGGGGGDPTMDDFDYYLSLGLDRATAGSLSGYDYQGASRNDANTRKATQESARDAAARAAAAAGAASNKKAADERAATRARQQAAAAAAAKQKGTNYKGR